jgi:hypothetical protein
VEVALADYRGTELLTGIRVAGTLELAALGAAVVLCE